MPKKITTKHVKKIVKKKQGSFIDKNWEYVNAETLIDLKCKKGHRFKKPWYHLKRGEWCTYCSTHKYTIDFCQQIAIQHEGKCLSNFYNNPNEKLLWECKEKHKWETKLADILYHKSWCPECSGNKINGMKIAREIARSKNGKCLSTEYVNNKSDLLWECHKGHQWYSTLVCVRNCHSWCPECEGVKKLTLEKAKLEAAKRNGECLSKEYKNVRTKLMWRCNKGHTWEARLMDIKNSHSWCPICNKKTEQKFRKTMENYFNAKFPSCRPSWLINPKTNRKLELDGYNENLKIAFEYQGPQHYGPFYYDGFDQKGFEKQKERDNIKKNKCEEQDILLIRIPYLVPEEKWGNLIQEEYNNFYGL
jgi:hypothetical protein